jgi:hypothetical protein
VDPPSFRTAIEPEEASICGGCNSRIWQLPLDEGRSRKRSVWCAGLTDKDPADGAEKNATGWVAADDMTERGVAAAKQAVPRRLGSVERPVAQDAAGKPYTFIVNGTNEQARVAKDHEWKYKGVTSHKLDMVINFFNLPRRRGRAANAGEPARRARRRDRRGLLPERDGLYGRRG